MNDIPYQLAREIEAAKVLMEQIRALAAEDDEVVRDTFEGETTLDKAIERALDDMAESEILIVGIKDREARLAERRARLAKRNEAVRGLIEMAMLAANWPKKKFPGATISVTPKAATVEVDDESAIPTCYFVRTDPKLSKKDLNTAVLDVHRAIKEIGKIKDPSDKAAALLAVIRGLPTNGLRDEALTKAGGINDPDERWKTIEAAVKAFPLIPGCHVEEGGTILTIRKS